MALGIHLLLFLGALTTAETPTKDPWMYTLHERVELRTNVNARTARRARDLPTIRQAREGWSPIDGRYEPELFLPSELLTELMRAANSARADAQASREFYREQIIKSGWNYDEFWRELETVGAEYFTIVRTVAEGQKATKGRLELAPFQRAICVQRTRMLQDARAKFGQEAFDRFLYTGVAPHLHAWYDDQLDTPEILIEREKPCS